MTNLFLSPWSIICWREESAVRVYRDYRGMMQKQLAEAAGINAVYLSQIGTGKRTDPARTLAALAVDVDDLI